MKTKTRLLALTAALALTASTAPAAWALQTEWIATGTVSDSYDTTGVFGLAGTSLDGDSFTADFFINTSNGTESSSPGYSDQVYGGTGYLSTLTPVSATLTINEITKVIGGSYAGEADTNTNGPPYFQSGATEADAENYTNGSYPNQISVGIIGYSGSFASTIGQPFSVAGAGGNSNFGEFTFSDDAGDSYAAEGDLTVNSISSAGVISAAPEPSTWTLLIAGVGVAGWRCGSGGGGAGRSPPEPPSPSRGEGQGWG